MYSLRKSISTFFLFLELFLLQLCKLKLLYQRVVTVITVKLLGLYSVCQTTCNEVEMLLSNWVSIAESKPTCCLSRNVTDAIDNVEILCHVRYNGSCTTPVSACVPHLPATHNRYQISSGHVLFRHVIAASDIDDFAVLNCSVTFNLTDDYTVMFPDIPVKPDKPNYTFVWSSPASRTANVSGKYPVYRYKIVNFTRMSCTFPYLYAAICIFPCTTVFIIYER